MNREQRITSLCCAALVTVVIGCAAPQPTSYEPLSLNVFLPNPYGYSDKHVGDDEYTVVVHGNSLTSRERAAQIALLRAAKLTIEQNRSHFLVMKRISETMSTSHSNIVTMFLPGVIPFSLPVGELSPTREPDVVLLIRLLPADASLDPDVINAAEIIKNLESELRSK